MPLRLFLPPLIVRSSKAAVDSANKKVEIRFVVWRRWETSGLIKSWAQFVKGAPPMIR